MQLRKMFVVFCLAILCTASTSEEVYSKQLTYSQKAVLSIAGREAQRNSLDPLLLKGMALQESKAGQHPNFREQGPKSSPYYGIMQLKLVALTDVLRRHPSMYNEYNLAKDRQGQIARLKFDDEFNISVAAKYLALLRERYGLASNVQLALGYNRGPNAARKVSAPERHFYVVGVKEHMRTLM